MISIAHLKNDINQTFLKSCVSLVKSVLNIGFRYAENDSLIQMKKHSESDLSFQLFRSKTTVLIWLKARENSFCSGLDFSVLLHKSGFLI